MVTRRSFLALSAAAAVAAPAKRPNILFILPDQLRSQALGCMGNPDCKTPNIDRMASEGLVLPNSFANTPVCCPARANMLTGTYAHRNGMVANDLRLRESQLTIADEFASAGYRTGYIGKWHLDGGPRMPGFVPPGPRRHGFQFWAANECAHTHFNTQYFRDTPDPIPVKKYEAEAWTDIALDFIKETRQPYFLMVSMGPPHDPYKAPPEFAKMYDPAKLTMRPNYQSGPGVPGPQQIAEYYGNVSAIDQQVGRLLAAADENTLVLLSSDHGDMLGSEGQRLKRKPWEESIRVPGIIRYPAAVRAGRRSDAFFTHVDFAPTLLSLCGIKPPGRMQGADLSGVVLGKSDKAPGSAFFQIFGPFQGDGTDEGWRGVRTSRYLYARYETKPWLLYDLDKDPYEMHNLLDDPGSQGLLKEMESRLTAWMNQTGDSWKYDWQELVEDKGRLYTGGTYYTVDEYLNAGKR